MNILKFLDSNKNTRKIFGERELKIIEKQLLGIELTQSEKNRLSRDIRKKFEFIKDIGIFSEEFKLKKGSLTKKIIEDTKETILNSNFYKRIKRITLYGSVIENKFTFRSDIDISVEFKNIVLKEATLFRKEILGKVNSKVDIQVYNFLPKKLKTNIKKEGRILYKNED